MVAAYKKKWQAWAMWLDDARPVKAIRRRIQGQVRQDGKREIEDGMSGAHVVHAAEIEDYAAELDDALYCHHYGPCPKCSGDGDAD